jgi:hypothetical protein
MVYDVDKLAKLGKDDLWIFTYQTGKARFKDYEKYCKNGRFQEGLTSALNKSTMNRFLKELREEEKIARGVDQVTGDKYNFVPEEKVPELRKLIDDRLLAQEVATLSEEERKKRLSKMLYEDQNKILRAIGRHGALFIREIAQQTELSELKVEETIWGPMLYTGTISADNNYQVAAKYRKYGLSVLGLYRALRVDMDNFDAIIEKWGILHPFVFGRLELIRKHNLESALKEFISTLLLDSHTGEGQKDTQERIETYLIALIISGFNYQYLQKWFELIHEDKEFRERVKTCFTGFINRFQNYITSFQYGLETIDMVGCRRPNWEEIKWREMPLLGLEVFLHFKEIDWEYYCNRPR